MPSRVAARATIAIIAPPMSWIAEDRRHQRTQSGQSLITDEMRRHVTDVLFPRYPSKRACLLPVLHLVQHEYNWISPEALVEVADLLELAPAEVLDTASFYEEYWLKPKGKYLVGVCRSLACEVCGSDRIIEGLVDKLGVEVGETGDDRRFTLIEMECLGSCGTAPVALVNDVLHETITLESISALIDTLPDDPHDYHDPTVDFDVPAASQAGSADEAQGHARPQHGSASRPGRDEVPGSGDRPSDGNAGAAKRGKGKKKGGR